MRMCPRCSAGEIEFNERYRVDGETIPAWFCESPRCGYVEFVRARKSRTSKIRQAPAELHLKAVRAVMAAHVRTEHSEKLIKPAARLSRREKND
jgi:hypothetical protein